MKDKRLSSSPSQVVNQELDDVAIKMPRMRERKNRFRLGIELRIKESLPYAAPAVNQWAVS